MCNHQWELYGKLLRPHLVSEVFVFTCSQCNKFRTFNAVVTFTDLADLKRFCVGKYVLDPCYA